MTALYPWQNDAWQSLQNLRARLPHALLLKGAQGIGKLELAQIFAQSLLCDAPLASGMPCQQCQSCLWCQQNSHPDLRLLQPDALSDSEEKDDKKKPSKEIVIEQIRALTHFANLTAHRGGYRIVLLHPVEAMNQNAANALLKTLEEPTEKLVFILVTHKPQQLLSTILSRCLSLTISTPSAEVGMAWLRQQGIQQPEQALAQAGFAPLKALQNSAQDSGEKELLVLLNAVQQPEQLDALALADSLQRVAPIHVVTCLAKWCYDLSSVLLTGRARYFTEQTPLLKKLGDKTSASRVLQFQQELKIAQREAFHPLNAKLQFEALLLAYQQIFSAKKTPDVY